MRLDNGVLLQQEEGELFLSSDVPWQLPSAVEQALRKGVAVHFVAEVQACSPPTLVLEQPTPTNGHALLPLKLPGPHPPAGVRTGSQPFNGLGFLGTALGNSSPDLADALQALQHWVRWRIGARDSLPPTAGAAAAALEH